MKTEKDYEMTNSRFRIWKDYYGYWNVDEYIDGMKVYGEPVTRYWKTVSRLNESKKEALRFIEKQNFKPTYEYV